MSFQIASAGGGGASVGGALTSGTDGSVLFVHPSGTIAQDNANLFWDATNKHFQVGINTIDIGNGLLHAVQTGLDTSTLKGVVSNVTQTNAGAEASGLVRGIEVVSDHNGAATLQVSGVTATAENIAGNVTGIVVGGDYFGASDAGTVPTVYGIRSQAETYGGTITDVIGVLGHAVNDGGTASNAYAFKADDVTGATNNYAIKTGLGLVSFGGNVTAPVINGTVSGSFNAISIGANGTPSTNQLKLNGSTSGSAILGVASAAGSPNEIDLPTTTGTTGQVLKTDGANPQQTSWTSTIPTVATIDLTGQTAAITATSLYTPAATGMVRINYYAKVTTAASVSSILGGTSGLVVTFTDGTDSVAQTAFTLPEDNQAGNSLSVGSGNTTNTTQAVLQGNAVVWAKTGVNMTYAFGYSSTGTAMAYELHIKVETL